MTVLLLMLGVAALALGAVLLVRSGFASAHGPYRKRKGGYVMGGILLGVGIDFVALAAILWMLSN